jgi:hypothetical protein
VIIADTAVVVNTSWERRVFPSGLTGQKPTSILGEQM